eukprot:TRINITY_DN10412_c0_g1_i1.p1 TRINITY_DN10412_c0_g1~~TRINITY_DN10412_c0_g1_i1.p1  ORF type:complete len:420 (-),score=68.84 TRINITY_DN10412_c0_g1_i1:305-1564(-)
MEMAQYQPLSTEDDTDELFDGEVTKDDALAINTESPEPVVHYAEWASFKVVVFLVIFYAITTIINNVTFFLIGEYMPGFPSFLLYGSTIPYCGLFAITTIVRWLYLRRTGGRLIFGPKKHVFLMGLWIGVNAVAAQFADIHTQADMQLLLQQLAVPCVGLAVGVYLRHSRKDGENRYTVAAKVLGSLFICIPVIISAVIWMNEPDTQQQCPLGCKWWGALAFGLANIAVAMLAIHEEKAYTGDPSTQADVILSQLVANAVCIIPYMFTIPLEMVPGVITEDGSTFTATIYNQYDALLCLAGQLDNPAKCKPGAWLPYLLFMLDYVLVDLSGAWVAKYGGADVSVMASIAIVPLNLVVNSWRAIFGKDAVPVDALVIMCAVLVPIGMLIYMLDKYRPIRQWMDRKAAEAKQRRKIQRKFV